MAEFCEECGIFFPTQEFVVHDLYNYIAKIERCYKKLDHFKEVLCQFQAREGKQIPAEILQKIREALHTNSEPNYADIRNTLRQLKLNRYVENIYFIHHVVTGQEAPHIPKLREEKMLRMFRQIERAFANTPEALRSKRKSFLNYFYVVYKLLELMGETELMGRISLLKTRLRVRQHDAVWRYICEELGWKFIPTSLKKKP
jgi:hypothetical protein